ncbi:hypothetical protein BDR07DRAFT_102510 [Suillus spraguei]|nr:hypothetical protein BDR07DRAFT_102510 [Suillus spraguei]
MTLVPGAKNICDLRQDCGTLCINFAPLNHRRRDYPNKQTRTWSHPQSLRQTWPHFPGVLWSHLTCLRPQRHRNFSHGRNRRIVPHSQNFTHSVWRAAWRLGNSLSISLPLCRFHRRYPCFHCDFPNEHNRIMTRSDIHPSHSFLRHLWLNEHPTRMMSFWRSAVSGKFLQELHLVTVIVTIMHQISMPPPNEHNCDWVRDQFIKSSTDI